MKTPGEKRVCVYCASSRSSDTAYRQAAYRLGEVLAGNRYTIVYGGGGEGSMGALADGALSQSGKVIGVLPKFMQELEWGHSRLTELRLVEDMRTRKHMMLSDSQAVIALPGGSGTLEELLEAVTLKRLGIYLNPIMQTFWNKIGLEKIDLTPLGHWSGTGLVRFEGTTG